MRTLFDSSNAPLRLAGNIAASLAGLLLLVGVIGAWRSNAASLRYLSGISAQIPDSHPRARYWEVVSALKAEEWELVAALAQPGAESGDWSMAYFFGQANLSMHSYEQAISAWSAINFSAGLKQIALQAREAGEEDAALQAYAAGWEIDPREATDEWVGYLLDLGRPGEAVDLLRASIRRVVPFERNIPYWYRSMANILTDLGRWQEALDAWQGVLEHEHLFYEGAHDPEKTYFGIAWALYELGRFAEARVSIDISLEYLTHPGSLLFAGNIYLADGDPEAALEAFQQVLNQDPDNTLALEAIRRLDQP